MGIFDHWHPMVSTRNLTHKPKCVRLGGTDIVLFRTKSGKIGVLDEMCPHRRMRLSLGEVVGEKLMCKYHGWTFGCDGHGESPGSPKLHACASSWEAKEEHGYIWAKSKTSTPVFPKFDVEGWRRMCILEQNVKAPLELVVDNFCEIEHTPTTHDLFGYDLNRMHEVTVRFETTDDTVKVINHGPPKSINSVIRGMVGIKKDHIFNDTWTTYFSPVYSVYDHKWMNPETGEEARVKWRVYVFFSPVSDHESRLTAFTYAKSSWRLPLDGGLGFAHRLMRRKVRDEIGLDVAMLEGLASHNTGIEGMKLSRFDKVLAMNRERIERVYRGKSEQESRRLKIV
ncbi:MAG: Rieske 2Fe-2S domain-containing protein [Planctomycetes bacterium]|nr:Rieske 2Fe-2S domain-containing protein [Planctomycetota bacterium]